MCYRAARIGGHKGGMAVGMIASIHHHRIVLPQRTNHDAATTEIYGAFGSVLEVTAYIPSDKELLVGDLDVIFDTHRG